MLVAFLAYATINIQTFNSVVEILETYFRCSVAGDRPECDVHKEEVKDAYQLPYYLYFFTFIMVSTINFGNFTYALYVQDIKLIIKKFCSSL